MKNGALILIFSIFSLTSFAETLTITMVGDTGFNKNNQVPMANFVEAYGQKTSWEELTEHIKPYIDSDLNFANVETVITESALPSAGEKKYKFQSHPNSIEHLIKDVGFNVFSLSNNHAGDYGRHGLESTYSWMNFFSNEYPIFHHGLGTVDELVQPSVFNFKNIKIALVAVGIDSFGLSVAPPTKSEIGSLNFHSQKQVGLALQNLKKTKADFKIISVHYGTEGHVGLDQDQQIRFHKMIDDGDADLIIGHHPHVVRPIEFYKGKLIIYSLGNFLLIGAANMDNNNPGKSYGLVVKTKIEISNNDVEFKQILALPIKGMHYKPKALSKVESVERIDFLNQNSYNEVGESAVLFTSHKNYGVWNK